MTGLRPVVDDEQLAVLRPLVDRRRSLGEEHTRMVAQLHRLLLELVPGGAKRFLSAAQAREILSKVRPRDAAGMVRRRVAAELVSDLERTYRRKKAADYGEHAPRTRDGLRFGCSSAFPSGSGQVALPRNGHGERELPRADRSAGPSTRARCAAWHPGARVT